MGHFGMKMGVRQNGAIDLKGRPSSPGGKVIRKKLLNFEQTPYACQP